jgi:hypothetical protein
MNTSIQQTRKYATVVSNVHPEDERMASVMTAKVETTITQVA